jgi:hypothetical protein
MTEQRSPSPWRLPVVPLLVITETPPLALVALILRSGDQRRVCWRSSGVKGGLAIAAIGLLPLLVVGMAAKLGLWSDPNPNPIGLGLLFLFAVVVGSLVAVFGVFWTRFQERRA